MKRILLLVALALAWSSPLVAQVQSFQGVAELNPGGGLLHVVPFAPVVFCNAPATGGTPCTNLATTYNSMTGSQACAPGQGTIPTTNICSSVADVNGNFGVYAAPGNYTYYFQANGVWRGPYNASLGGSGAGNPNLTFSGTNSTFSGPVNLNGGPLTVYEPTTSVIGFDPDPFCAYVFPEGFGLDQMCDLNGTLFWNPFGLTGQGQAVLTARYQPANPANGQFYVWNNGIGHVDLELPPNTLIDPITGALQATFVGPTANNNPACNVNGVTYSTLAGCVGYFATNNSGGRIDHNLGAEDITVNPFQLGMGAEVKLGKGIHSGGANHPCGTANLNCYVAEVPLILPNGTRVRGSGLVQQEHDPSEGTMITYGTSFPSPLGSPVVPTPTQSASGGSLSDGTVYFVTSEVNNLQTNSSYTAAQGTPGVGLHSSEFSITLNGGGSSESITVPAPTVLGSGSFVASEYYVYATSGFTGTVTTSAGVLGACPANCVQVTAGSNFSQNEDVSLIAGTPIVINSVTYYLLQIYSPTIASLMSSPGTQSGVTYTSSLAAWQQVLIGTNGTCASSRIGLMDPTGCLLTAATTVTTLAGTGEPPLPVDVSNPLIVIGDQNGTKLEFSVSLEDVSLNLTNGSSATTAVPTANAPATVIYVNSAQEGSYMKTVDITGASQQSYAVFSNDAPNFAFTDSITGGGPNGYSGTLNCTSATPAVCTVASGNPVGNWWGATIKITGSSCASSICQVQSVNSATSITLTTATGSLTGAAYCMGTTGACSASTTGGNFIDYVIDGTLNPSAIANGTLREFRNVSVSSKGGVGVFSEALVRGQKAAPVFTDSHFEQNASSGNDCVTTTAKASAILIGDKHQCYTAVLHMTATASATSGAVLNAENIGTGFLTENDNIAAGTGNCLGTNSDCNNPGANVFGTTINGAHMGGSTSISGAVTLGTAPVGCTPLTSTLCGVGSIGSGVSTNTDLNGELTMSGGTKSYTFLNTNYAVHPTCVGSDETAIAAVEVTYTAGTSVTFTTSGATDVVSYSCDIRK
jgi:hypothetical protein